MPNDPLRLRALIWISKEITMADLTIAEDEDADFPPVPDMGSDVDSEMGSDAGDDVPPLADPVALPPPASEAAPVPSIPERTAEGGNGGAEGGGGDGGGGGFLVWNEPSGGDFAGLPWLDPGLETGSAGSIPVWGNSAPDEQDCDFGFGVLPAQFTPEAYTDHGLDVFY
jgi:hypothetical protein